MTAVPKYATKLRKRARNDGDRIASVAEALGTPYMPWQRDFVALGTQRKYGKYERSQVVGTVPRQSGKTFGIRPVLVDRALENPGMYGTYIAHKRKVAAKRLRDLANVLKRSGIDRGAIYTSGVGNEELRFSNGSIIDIQSPNSAAGHSDSIDIAVLDEAWAIDMIVLSGIRPAMSARPDAQLWIISTQGYLATSELLNSFCDRARANPQGPIAYLEYSMPDDAHVYDETRWHEWMPALGITVQPSHIIEDMEILPPHEFLRAYGNIAVSSAGDIIPLEWWNNAQRDLIIPRGVTIAVDGSPKGACVTIAYQINDEHDDAEGRQHWHIDPIEYRDNSEPNASWVVDRVTQLARYSPVTIAVDPASSIASEVPALQDIADTFGVPLRKFSLRDRCAADAWLVKGLRKGTVTHSILPALEEAVEKPVIKAAGELWRFDRMLGTTDMSPLIAASMAAFTAYEHELTAPVVGIF